jgi:hypothetical protein
VTNISPRSGIVTRVIDIKIRADGVKVVSYMLDQGLTHRDSLRCLFPHQVVLELTVGYGKVDDSGLLSLSQLKSGG